jgi:hypothetical protein
MGRERMDFITTANELLNKTHPEVIDIPGCIQYNYDFHLPVFVRVQPVYINGLIYREVNPSNLRKVTQFRHLERQKP